MLAPAAMKRARRNQGNVFPPPFPMNQGDYQELQPPEYVPRIVVNNVGPSRPVREQQLEEAREEFLEGGANDEQIPADEGGNEEDEEEEDANLMQQMGRSTIKPSIQLDNLLRYIKIGFFLSTLEVLLDNASEDKETIRKEAEKKWRELLQSTGDLDAPGSSDSGNQLCGTEKIQNDVRLMAKHTDYIAELLVKFITDFDGSAGKLFKIRKATGFIKGLMLFDPSHKCKLYNNVSEAIPGNFNIDLDNFKNNAVLFFEYLRSYQETREPYPKCLALLLPNE